MTLVERLSAQGRQLFASRTIRPLVPVPIIAVALPESWTTEGALGESGSRALEWAALLVAFAGLVLRCATVAFAPHGTSSRDTRALRAPSLNTTGLYSVLRHPLYLGAGLMWIGVAMSLRVWWLVLIVMLAYWLYIERVAIAEEQFLAETFLDQYQSWIARTPAFLPRWSGWKRPAGPLQVKRILSEHNGLLAVAIAFVLLQYVEDRQNGGEPWSKWYGDHKDLLLLLVVAIAVSLTCITIRRSPWLRDRTAGNSPEPSAATRG